MKVMFYYSFLILTLILLNPRGKEEFLFMITGYFAHALA